jgi:hypothetical protein
VSGEERDCRPTACRDEGQGPRYGDAFDQPRPGSAPLERSGLDIQGNGSQGWPWLGLHAVNDRRHGRSNGLGGASGSVRSDVGSGGG